MVLATLLLASCTARLGLVYIVKKQSLEVHYLAGDSPRLAIHARYRVKNTGNRDVAFLDLRVPAEEKFGTKNLRVTLDGGEVATSPTANRGETRVSFPQPWARAVEHELSVEYELAQPPATSAVITRDRDSFFLSTPACFPMLLAQERLLGKGGERARPLEMNVRVPEGFLAQAAGRLRGVRKENSELVYRFQITKEDFDPFVVAGRYHESRFSNQDATIIFWTFERSGSQPVDSIGQSLGSVAKWFQNEYGPLSKKPQPFWIVEKHLIAPTPDLNAFSLPDTNFPRGAIFSWAPLDLEGASALEPVEGDLARSWFEELARPDEEAKPVLAWALARHAAHAARAQLHQDRTDSRERIGEAIRAIDAERSKSKDKTLVSLAENDSAEQLNMGFLKADLFLDALDERCGSDNLRQAMRHLVQSFRGSTYGYNELRSTLEQECHQDLGPMFREWLTETGIPADFRRRYKTVP
jgi:hypothetical protein